MSAEHIAEHIQQQIAERGGLYRPSSITESFAAFAHAVDWSERWIQSLLLLSAALIIITLALGRRTNVQIGILLACVVGVALASTLNDWANSNWERFSKQNYFDASGVFIGVVYCGPLLLTSFLVAVNLLINTAQLLVKVKKLQFEREKRAKSRNSTQQSTGEIDTPGEPGASARRRRRAA